MKSQILNIKPVNFRAVVLAILFGLTVSSFVFAQEQGEAEKHFSSGKANFDQL